MAKVTSRSTINFKVTLELDYKEASALAELGAWGAEKAVDALAERFSTKMLEEHRTGLASLLKTSREQLCATISLADDCEKVFRGERKIVQASREDIEHDLKEFKSRVDEELKARPETTNYVARVKTLDVRAFLVGALATGFVSCVTLVVFF